MALQELSKFSANAYAVSGDVAHLQQVQLTLFTYLEDFLLKRSLSLSIPYHRTKIGTLIFVLICRILISFHWALLQELPSTVQVCGRISPPQVWDYLERIKTSTTRVSEML